ncbi:MAG TPA: hypothetical protein VEI05_01800 [Burkholderiaceae bacterium]|nr:hypothetical protein [Burkholderiaceae bacterium]
MTKVPDNITVGELVSRSARALARAGLQHRIDIYRDVEVDDPAVFHMLGQKHPLRVRIRITATSLLLDPQGSTATAVNAPGFRERQA